MEMMSRQQWGEADCIPGSLGCRCDDLGCKKEWLSIVVFDTVDSSEILK